MKQKLKSLSQNDATGGGKSKQRKEMLESLRNKGPAHRLLSAGGNLGSIARRRRREIHLPERASLGVKTKSHPRKLGFPTDEPKGGGRKQATAKWAFRPPGAKPKLESVPTQCEWREGEGERRRRAGAGAHLRGSAAAKVRLGPGLPPMERGEGERTALRGVGEWVLPFRGRRGGCALYGLNPFSSSPVSAATAQARQPQPRLTVTCSSAPCRGLWAGPACA
jgi:hypothetical protein